jgi:hypothetical protein
MASVGSRYCTGDLKPLLSVIHRDARQDREKNLLQKIYEGLVGGVSQ